MARRDRASREQYATHRDELGATLDPALVALYERQRAGGGPGAGPCRAIGAGLAG